MSLHFYEFTFWPVNFGRSATVFFYCVRGYEVIFFLKRNDGARSRSALCLCDSMVHLVGGFALERALLHVNLSHEKRKSQVQGNDCAHFSIHDCMMLYEDLIFFSNSDLWYKDQGRPSSSTSGYVSANGILWWLDSCVHFYPTNKGGSLWCITLPVGLCILWWIHLLLSSAVKLGTHFLENKKKSSNKITTVFTMLKLCVSKERLT